MLTAAAAGGDTTGALEGKCVIVTGAGRGLGEAYARLAAAEGAAVVVNDVDPDGAQHVAEAINQAGGRAVAHVADVASWPAAEALVASALEHFGRLDGLVNNAGRFHAASSLEQDEETFRRLLEVNVVGVAACGTHAMRHMVARGEGSIVNVVSGAFVGMSAVGAYGATKGAVASLTYTWAIELAGTGVRVNAISPLARTRMVEDMFAFHSGEPGWGEDGLNGLPPPGANAPAVIYLLSDRSSAVHGQVLQVTGRELALIAHPGVLDPSARGAAVSIDSVAEAMAGPLAPQRQPVGLHRTQQPEPR